MQRSAILNVCLMGLVLGCGNGVDSSQTPPMGRASIEQWLSTGPYKAWRCEGTAHPARSPSPHGMNRICSNGLISQAGGGEYPVESSNVKELYNDAGSMIVGYAVSLHVTTGKTGDTWYWYERVPPGTMVPGLTIDQYGVVADGTGGSGQAKSVCVGCHQGAGSDAMHSGHDFVYTQVK